MKIFIIIIVVAMLAIIPAAHAQAVGTADWTGSAQGFLDQFNEFLVVLNLLGCLAILVLLIKKIQKGFDKISKGGLFK
jgi:hypothetical protein